MIRLIYVSTATHEPSEQELIDLLKQARDRNIAQDVTGMLLHKGRTYLQVLEGEARDVHEIYNAICEDSRHRGIVKILEESIPARDFPDWSMGFRDLAACSPEELAGYSGIFSGDFDPQVLRENRSLAVDLLMDFARDADSS